MKHLRLQSAVLLPVLATGDSGERFRVGEQIMTPGGARVQQAGRRGS